jgi:hypothetical protein
MTKQKATGGTGMLRELGRNQNSADPAQLITKAIKEGRITADERAHYTARFKSDPDGTRKLLTQLAPGRPPQSEPPGTGLLPELQK